MDEFFRPPGSDRLLDWDGNPKVGMPPDVQKAYLEAYTPHWHGCALGPPPYGSQENVVVSVDLIYQPTREEAEQSIWLHVYNMCQVWGREYDEDEWVIHHLTLVNGN